MAISAVKNGWFITPFGKECDSPREPPLGHEVGGMQTLTRTTAAQDLGPKPDNILAFEERFLNTNARETASLVRRLTGCSALQAKEFVETFSKRWSEGPKLAWPRQIKSHPDLVAAMIGDPSPTWVTKLTNQRAELLRLLRRGRTLDAARIVERVLGADSIQARKFVQRLNSRAHCIVELLRFYETPIAHENPFAKWPPPAPEKLEQLELFMMPSEFSFETLYGLIHNREHRSSSAMLRKFGQCPPQQALEIVNLLEDAGALGADQKLMHQAMLRRYPGVVARLEGRPEPAQLDRLQRHAVQIQSLLSSKRSLQAIRLIESTLNVSRREAQLLCRHYQNLPPAGEDKPISAQLEKLELEFGPPPTVQPEPVATAAPQPKPVETPPPPVAKPAVAAKPPETNPPAAKPPEVKAPEAKSAAVKPAEAKVTVKPPTKAPHLATTPSTVATIGAASGSTSDFFSHPTPETEPVDLSTMQIGQIDSLDDAIELLDMLNEVMKKEGPEQAKLLYGQLERTGFSRAWVISRAPMMDKLLPAEPWKDRLPMVLPLLQSLKTMGKPKQAKEVLAMLDQALEQGVGGGVAAQIASYIDPQELLDLQSMIGHGDFKGSIPILEKILQSSEGEATLRAKLPLLNRVFGDEPITVERIRNLAKEPHLMLVAMLEKKNPELLAQLDTVKLTRLAAGLPQLKNWLKQMQFHKASVFLFKELKLGPSDISDLLKVLRELM